MTQPPTTVSIPVSIPVSISISISISIPDCAPATLTLPDPLTLKSIARLEQAIASMFRMLRKDLCGDAADDPGAIEVDSWSIHLH